MPTERRFYCRGEKSATGGGRGQEWRELGGNAMTRRRRDGMPGGQTGAQRGHGADRRPSPHSTSCCSMLFVFLIFIMHVALHQGH